MREIQGREQERKRGSTSTREWERRESERGVVKREGRERNEEIERQKRDEITSARVRERGIGRKINGGERARDEGREEGREKASTRERVGEREGE